MRLEAVRALSFVPTAAPSTSSGQAAAEIALEALQHPVDYYLQYTLDSTMTTLEKAWKPALTAGSPIAADNPEGLAFLLARLDPNELIALPRIRPSFGRSSSGRASTRAPGGRRSTASPRRRTRLPAQELVGAIERLDGEPGTPAGRAGSDADPRDVRCRRPSPASAPTS